jgi:hypothetical protein
VRPDGRARADLGAWMHQRGGVDLGAVGDHAEQQFSLGDDLIADMCRRPRARQRRAPPGDGHLEPEAIAGHHLPPELRVVDAAQVDAGVRRAAVALQQQHRRHL